MPSDPAHFYSRTRAARKVIVVDLGFLGDTVHLVPALWDLKAAYAAASLHVLTSPVGDRAAARETHAEAAMADCPSLAPGTIRCRVQLQRRRSHGVYDGPFRSPMAGGASWRAEPDDVPSELQRSRGPARCTILRLRPHGRSDEDSLTGGESGISADARLAEASGGAGWSAVGQVILSPVKLK